MKQESKKIFETSSLGVKRFLKSQNIVYAWRAHHNSILKDIYKYKIV